MELVVALIAAVGAYGHIGWAVYSARRAERSDVRVSVRHEPTAVASGSYLLTVVVTNHGPVTERIERVGLWFYDATGIFPPDWNMSEQGSRKEVDVDVAPRSNYRWSYDFGDVRFRHGLGYRAWAQLATGTVVEGEEGVADAYSLEIAGLSHLTGPIQEQHDADEDEDGA